MRRGGVWSGIGGGDQFEQSLSGNRLIYTAYKSVGGMNKEQEMKRKDDEKCVPQSA